MLICIIIILHTTHECSRIGGAAPPDRSNPAGAKQLKHFTTSETSQPHHVGDVHQSRGHRPSRARVCVRKTAHDLSISWVSRLMYLRSLHCLCDSRVHQLFTTSRIRPVRGGAAPSNSATFMGSKNSNIDLCGGPLRTNFPYT